MGPSPPSSDRVCAILLLFARFGPTISRKSSASMWNRRRELRGSPCAALRAWSPRRPAWVAVTDRDIAGYLIAFLGSASYGGEEFAWFKQRTQNFVYVDQVALARSYRGRGIGSVLYSELERWGSRQQCESLSCEVNLDPPNPASMAFHMSYGFIQIGRMHTSDGRHVALLQKAVRS